MIERLREVRVLTGFTRIEPPTQNIYGEFDLHRARAAPSLSADWLPATEIRGEGFFVELDLDKPDEWETRPAVIARQKQLESGWKQRYPKHHEQGMVFPGIRFYLLHTLAHLLTTQVSLECGYAASAIRERIYCSPPERPGALPMAGFLLSTGSTGSEGTLGGLVDQGRRLAHHLGEALRRAKLCSHDPVCGRAQPKLEYRVERRYGTTSPELVWSGDTGPRSCARKTRYVIEDLFASAHSRVLIAGYSFDYATDLFEPLFDRAEVLARDGRPLPTVRVILDCSRERSLPGEPPEALARRVGKQFVQTCWRRDSLLAELLYYKPSIERTDSGRSLYSMHAKCVIVDGNVALVGSANISNRGRDRNLEVGALIRDHHFVQSLLAAWDEVEGERAPVPD